MPHPAVVEAARLVIKDIESDKELSDAFAEGKMLGVLVCSGGCYLAAFSGNVGGRSQIAGFVPPIFDLLDPSGHFKVREAEISLLNHKINTLSRSEQLTSLEAAFKAADKAKEKALADFRMQMIQCKIRREEVRNETSDPHIIAGLIKESQHEKAELKRLKAAWDTKIAGIKVQLQVLRDEISTLKNKRAAMSDELQDWIFRQYMVHNPLGEESSIADIFSAQGSVPPGGTGECAAPKLLEYAYRNGLQPLAMGEFWYGKSPDTAVRTHGHFYPSCTSKCGPLLNYMMKGLSVDQHSAKELPSPVIIFEDDTIIIVEKPSGMPSVPGLDGRTSLLEWLRTSRHGSHDIFPVHRLDMDTSGVMIFAKTEKAAVNLQRQFEEHGIRKTYRARVTGEALSEQSDGEITLPLSPDYDERPRQKVDFTHGKDAVTRYHISCINPDNTADLILHPHTGRTHQLRVHCAHRLGLCSPILGDMLYGGHTNAPAAGRLCLHALSITFRHPDTDEEMTFTSRQLSY